MFVLVQTPGHAASQLSVFLRDVAPTEMVPGATRFGAPQGDPLAVPAYQDDTLVGYVFLNSDAVNSIGYSGKPIHILVGLAPNGVITGVKLVKHYEPIVLIGIPEAKIRHFIDGYLGANVLDLLNPERRDEPPVDIISGATVTVLIIHDTIIRSAIKIIRSRRLAGLTAGPEQTAPPRTIDLSKTETTPWEDLLKSGAVRRLNLSIKDINAAFAKAGPQAAIDRPEDGPETDDFIDMYAAVVSVPGIGRSLLGDAEYELLKARLEPGQGALLFAANGRYSFKGSGYVRGGIFDRIHVVQGDDSFRFRDKNHKRIGDIEAKGAPRFTEIALFVIPKSMAFNHAMPWRVITVTAPNTIIRNLTIRNSGARLDLMDAGVYLDKRADDAVVENNRLIGNLFGIYLQGPERAIVRNNAVVGRQDLRVNERGNAIQLWNTPGSVVEGNRVRYGRDGIFVTTSRNNIFRNNSFSNLRFAIHYMYTNDSEISGNSSTGNHIGYALMSSHRLLITNNSSVGDRDHGIMLNYTNGSVIEGNTVRNGKTKCVFIYNSNKNRFVGNRFEGCGIGVHFTAGSEQNIITKNAFIGNRTQVKYVGTRWLDWSDNGVGNYWSDNPAFDLDGDLIADTAYRPNDLVDQIVWRAPAAKVLLTSPAVHLLRWAQSQFPGLHPGGVIDSAPLMKPINLADAPND